MRLRQSGCPLECRRPSAARTLHNASDENGTRPAAAAAASDAVVVASEAARRGAPSYKVQRYRCSAVLTWTPRASATAHTLAVAPAGRASGGGRRTIARARSPAAAAAADDGHRHHRVPPLPLPHRSTQQTSGSCNSVTRRRPIRPTCGVRRSHTIIHRLNLVSFLVFSLTPFFLSLPWNRKGIVIFFL